MELKTARLAVALCLGSLAFCHAYGSTILVEPDSFPEGANIGSAFPGVVLSVEGKSNAGVFAVSGFWYRDYATTGALVFGQMPEPSVTVPTGWDENLGLLRADFSSPAYYVQIDLIFDDDDVAALWAFDSDANLLEKFVTFGDGHGNGAGPPVVTAIISRPDADIAYVFAGGVGAEAVLLDNLQVRVSSIPEPMTIALLGLGLVGIAATRQHIVAERLP